MYQPSSSRQNTLKTRTHLRTGSMRLWAGGACGVAGAPTAAGAGGFAVAGVAGAFAGELPDACPAGADFDGSVMACLSSD